MLEILLILSYCSLLFYFLATVASTLLYAAHIGYIFCHMTCNEYQIYIAKPRLLKNNPSFMTDFCMPEEKAY